MKRRPRLSFYLATLLAAAFYAVALPAYAVSLWWEKTPVHTASHNVCISFAGDAMRNLNFQNVRKSADEVAGTSGSAYAAITCVAANPSAIAIIMVAGNDSGETSRVANSLRQKIAGIVNFD
jgi:spore coat protein U-like protein